MDDHAHRHEHTEPIDWARQHHELGAAREPGLAKASKALLDAVGIAASMRVLDVACGAGDTAAAATDAGADAVGIDSSMDMVRIASDRFPGTRFVEGDMLEPPEGPWDAVVCRLGAHHADPAWLRAAWEVLRPGGRLAIAERDAVDEEDRAKGMKTLEAWRTLFHASGFEDVAVTPSGAELDGPIFIIAGRRPKAAGS